MASKVSTIAASFAKALFATSLFATSLFATFALPSAASASDHRAIIAHRVHHASAAHRWGYHYRSYARRGAPTFYDYNHPAATGGYVFIPGKGIAGEACNLPTSTCSNEYRDTQ